MSRMLIVARRLRAPVLAIATMAAPGLLAAQDSTLVTPSVATPAAVSVTSAGDPVSPAATRSLMFENPSATAPLRSRDARSQAATSAAVGRREDAHVGAGQNVALMVVGAAALVTGLIIGGGAGAVIAVGGAGIGLYGLYRFVQ